MPSASVSTGQRKQLARSGVGNVIEHIWNDAGADDDRESHERGDFQRRHGQCKDDARVRPAVSKQHRQQHEREHREQIFDDQPADGDVSGRRMKVAVIGEHADEHDGARDRERHAEDDPRRPAPAEPTRDDGAEQRGDGALRDGAGNGDTPDGQQFFDVELQADAEHQQDDADFGELFGDFRVGDEARRVRTDQRAGQRDSRRSGRALRAA